MLKCLKHDRYDVLGEAPSESGTRDMVVNVVYQNSQNTTHLTVVPGPRPSLVRAVRRPAAAALDLRRVMRRRPGAWRRRSTLGQLDQHPGRG